MMTNEQCKEYEMNGKALKQSFKKTIGKLLLDERIKKNLRLEEIVYQTGIKQHKIEDIEFGKHKFHWCIVAKLLELYNKRLEINLIDK